MRKARFIQYRLAFNFLAVTSRASMTYKDTYFIVLEQDGRQGIGECALFRGLSIDDRPDYERMLRRVCDGWISGEIPDLRDWPSIRFGLETSLLSLSSDDMFSLFTSAWSRGDDSIKINGLVWMGSEAEMRSRVREKIDKGFRCVKLKIGGVDFERELSILQTLRREFSPSDLEIRLDANGAFTPANALERLYRLSEFSIHSIEQPVKPRQWPEMAEICRLSPIDIALDEELIGINHLTEKETMLSFIKPRYIILKPALCGGFSGADEWIDVAQKLGIDWWATSALESNIGLNAIAQWCYTKHPERPQGLGTGLLYTNNIDSPLVQLCDTLAIDKSASWNLPWEWTK